MRYYSTSQPEIKVSMHDAVSSCVPQAGGLYMPEYLPKVPAAFVHNAGDMTLREIAYAMTDVFMGADISSATIKKVVDDALSFPTPLVNLGDGVFVLELFHGPTKVFKDIGARFLAGFFDSLNPHDGTKLNVLVTTTGNTGAAVANAFAGKPDINVFILFPHGAVSRHDAVKIKAAGSNIFPVEIGGTIDDCKAMVSSAFGDRALRDKVLLTTANSVNFARLMPQVALFFYGIGRLVASANKASNADVAVPSGNLGMLTAGLIAKRIGLKCGSLIAACNANDSFDRFVKSGELNPKPTQTTLARLMDVSNPSNLPRLLALCSDNIDILRRDVVSASIDDETIAATIRGIYDKYGYIADPHTAVALAAIGRLKDKSSETLVMATAAPEKSSEVMKMILGSDFRSINDDLSTVEPGVKIDRLPPTYPALKKYLLSHQ